MNLDWYNTLNKPLFTPPSEIFAPAWLILYILIFVSLYIFIKTRTDKSKSFGILLFVIQMGLNLLWSPVFFYFRDMKAAFYVIILLVIFLILNIVSFYKISKISAILLIPYLLWVCFAIYLNYGFMVLN